MALDVYVMPLWRFKAGYFESPLENVLGIKPRIVTLLGIQSLKYCWRRRQASESHQQVLAVKKEVARQSGAPIDWSDDGPVLYSQQAGGFEGLRAYAKWLDCRDQLPKFTAPEDDNFYKHPVWGIDGDTRLSCPHLVEHDCFSGYFLPCDFHGIARVEPFEVFGRRFERPVGSSFLLREELKFVNQHLKLNVQKWSDDETAQACVETAEGSRMADPLYYVKWAFVMLDEVSTLSCEHGLPIIFCG